MISSLFSARMKNTPVNVNFITINQSVTDFLTVPVADAPDLAGSDRATASEVQPAHEIHLS